MSDVVTDDGVRLHYVVDDFRDPWLGDPRTAVLLNHGYPKNSEFWRPFVPSIARRYRVVRHDVRGVGQSGLPPPGSEWSVDRLVADALTLADRLEIEKVHWAGFESGGLIGMFFAARYPERTASLACFNTPYRNASSSSKVHDRFSCGYASPYAAIDALGARAWIGKLRDQDVLTDRSHAESVPWITEQAASLPASVLKDWHRVFSNVWHALEGVPQRVVAPTLLVAGATHTTGCEPPLLDELRAKLANARPVVYVPDVSISVQTLAADACAEIYLDFLNGLDRA